MSAENRVESDRKNGNQNTAGEVSESPLFLTAYLLILDLGRVERVAVV